MLSIRLRVAAAKRELSCPRSCLNEHFHEIRHSVPLHVAMVSDIGTGPSKNLIGRIGTVTTPPGDSDDIPRRQSTLIATTGCAPQQLLALPSLLASRPLGEQTAVPIGSDRFLLAANENERLNSTSAGPRSEWHSHRRSV